MIYTGIGSRRTPPEVLQEMANLSAFLSGQGVILRSGGAAGADSAFEKGSLPHLKQIFLPWDGFNGRVASEEGVYVPEGDVARQAARLASDYHPNWSACSSTARKMHTRNTFQILGQDLLSPCDFVVCWTPDGKVVGGTGQALRIALDHDIPIFNYGTPDSYVQERITEALEAWL